MRLAAPYMLAVILPWLLLWTFFERRYARRPGLSFSQISFFPLLFSFLLFFFHFYTFY